MWKSSPLVEGRSARVYRKVALRSARRQADEMEEEEGGLVPVDGRDVGPPHGEGGETPGGGGGRPIPGRPRGAKSAGTPLPI